MKRRLYLWEKGWRRTAALLVARGGGGSGAELTLLENLVPVSLPFLGFMIMMSENLA